LKAAGTRPEPAVSEPSEKAHLARRDRDRRARARAAGNIVGIEWIARHAVGRAHPDQAGGELVEVGLADHDGAGLDQAPHHLGRELGLIGETRAGGGGRQAGHVDVVLHRERDAVERQRIDLAAPLVEPVGLGAQDRFGDARDPDLVVAGGGNAFQDFVDHLLAVEDA